MLTVAVGGWFFLFRGSAAPSGDFISAEHRYVEAARELPVAAQKVQRILEFHQFDATAQDIVARMQTELAVFQRLAQDEEGTAADIAQRSAGAAQLGATSADLFRVAFLRNRLSDAKGSMTQVEDAITELEKHAAEWKKL